MRNEDVVGVERGDTVRGRYLARQSNLTAEQAHAVAWRELGYATPAIARWLVRAVGPVTSRLDRTAAQYGLSELEGKWPTKRGVLTLLTPERLLANYPAIYLQYCEVAERSPSIVPAPVLETITELNEHGTRLLSGE